MKNPLARIGLGILIIALIAAAIGTLFWPKKTPMAAGVLFPLSVPKVGTQIVSRILLQNEGQFRLGGEVGDPALVDHRLKSSLAAELSETVLSVTDGRIESVLTVKASQLDVSTGQPSEKLLKEEIAKGLALPTLIVRSERGLVLDVKAHPESSDSAREYVALLAKSMQFSWEEKNHWSAEENDQNGRYEAEYTVQSGHSDGQVVINRQRTHYKKLTTRMDSAVGNTDLQSKTKGSLSFVADEEKRDVIQIKGEETLEFFDQNSQKLGFQTLRLDWTLLSRNTLPSSDLQTLKPSMQTLFANRPTFEESRQDFQTRQDRMMYESRLGSSTIQDIQAEYGRLQGAPPSKENDDRLIEAFLKLRAFVYLHPDRLDAWVKDLATLPIDSTYVQSALSAMTNISSPGAQKALVEMSRMKEGDEKAMQTLITNLGFLQAPEDFVSDRIRELKASDQTRGIAELAFGIMGSQLSKVDSPEASARLQEIESEIFAEVEAAKAPSDVAHYLGVLGNLASINSVALLEASLSSELSSIRENSVFALRDIDSESARQLIFRTLKTDSEELVRMSAAESLSHQRPSVETLQAVISSLEKESSDSVRTVLLRSLEKARHIDRDVVYSSLKKIQDEDRSETVKNAAALLLVNFESN